MFLGISSNLNKIVNKALANDMRVTLSEKLLTMFLQDIRGPHVSSKNTTNHHSPTSSEYNNIIKINHIMKVMDPNGFGL